MYSSKIIALYLLITIASSAFLQAQCPDKNALWKRLVLLRDSLSIPPRSQLKELMDFESRIKACPEQKDSVHAFLLERIAVMYGKTGDYYSAVKSATSAISLVEENSSKSFINKNHLAHYYYTLAALYDSLNIPTEKIKALDSCISISIRINIISLFSLYALIKRIEYLKDVGDYQRCVNDAILGEELTKRNLHNNDSMAYIDRFHEWKATALLQMKNYDAVEQLYLDKLNSLKGLQNNGLLATLYEQLGEATSKKKNYRQAALYFDQAIKYDKTNNDLIGCAITMYNKGYYLFDDEGVLKKITLHYYLKALDYLKQANKNATPDDRITIKFESLNVYANIANLYVSQGKYDSAFANFQRAFDILKPGMNEMDLLQRSQSSLLDNKSIGYIIAFVIDKGVAFLKAGKELKRAENVQQAVNIFKVADKLITIISTKQTEAGSKLIWREETKRLYENAIAACFLTNNNEDAFYFFEKSRAVLLNEQLKQQSALSRNDMLRQAVLKRKLLVLTRQTVSQNNSDLQSEIFSVNAEIEHAAALLKSHNPLYYQSFFDTNAIQIEDVQNKLLKNKTSLLEFFNGDSAVYSIFITYKNVVINKIDKEDFEKKVNAHISYLNDLEMLNKDFTGFTKNANELYELIFKNIPLSAGRIIISPDGKYFPFETLVTNTTTSTPVYFLNNHITSYTYSARYLLNDFSHDSVSVSGNFMGMAPVQFSPLLHLGSLNESDHSLNTIASYFGNAKNFVQQEASKNNFLQQFYGYKIIQFYTHSSDSSSNGEPVIYFADSALYLSDLIAEAKPATQLIVLSACETGNGKLYQGEGVFSFNRGFAAIGVPSSVTNLWSVDNESTYKLTELFYKYVAKGLPLDEALQKAKLEFIQTSSKEKSLPYYWAASVLVGKTDAIELKKGQPWKYFAGAITLLGIFVFGWNIKRKKRMTDDH